MAIFTVFWMVFKQTLKNWRLELVLLFGLILAVAISSVSLSILMEYYREL